MSSPTSTSLTLRALLKTAAGRLDLGAPGRGVSGLTPPAKALFAAAAAVRQTTVLVASSDAEVEQLTSDARFFFSALEGVSDVEAARTVLPFPSHEVDPYRGLAPHFDVASARARALYHAEHRWRPACCRIGGGAVAATDASRPAQECRTHVRSGDDVSPVILEIVWSKPATAARIRPTNRVNSRCGAGSSTYFRQARGSPCASSSSATQSNRSGLTTRRPSDRPEASTKSTSFRCRSWCRRPRSTIWQMQARHRIARRPSSTTSPITGRSCWCRSRTRFVRAFDKLHTQIEDSYGEAIRKNRPVPEPSTLIVDWSELALQPRAIDLARDAGSRRRRGSSRRVSAGHGVLWSRARLGGGAPTGSRARRDHRLRRTFAGPRRTGRRAARGLRDARGCRSNAARMRTRERCSSPSAICPRASACPTPACSSGPRPMCSMRSAGPTNVAGRRRQTFLSDFRDLKAGDLVVHVDHGIGVFVGLKQIEVGLEAAGVHGAPLRRRRQVVRPGRTSRPRPEVHRRVAAGARPSRRHHLGEGEDAGSRKPCATWRRSC